MNSPKGRTVVERRQASAPAAEGRRKPALSWREPHPLVRTMKHCVCRRSASLFFISFVLPFSVIAGLNPAIHAEAKIDRTYRLDFASRSSAWTTGSNPVVTQGKALLFDIAIEDLRAHRIARTVRHCERSEAIQLGAGELDCFVASLLAMTCPLRFAL
jgi:hypothetical protein